MSTYRVSFQNSSTSENDHLSLQELSERLKYMIKVVFPAIDKKPIETQAKVITRLNAFLAGLRL
jgi:hypothetical protein